MKVPTVVLFLLVAFLGQSRQQCLTPNDAEPTNRITRQGLYTGQQDFSLALLNAIHTLMPRENLFFSPYSTYHALLIAYFISGNQTSDYLKKVLRLDSELNKHDIYNAYKVDRLTTIRRAANASYAFTNANKVYVGDHVTIRECMKNLLDYELERAAFRADPETARREINAWVEERTHQMIRDLLPGGSINSETNLVLVNAAYFKGVWVNKFNTNETRQEVFYVSPSKQIMVDMMHVEGTFNHDVSETLGAHILELPYEGDKISMYIFLPPFTKDDAVDNTLKKLTVDEFKKIVESHNLVEKTVNVALPRFSLEQTIELVPILESLGVGNLFQSEADFSPLSTEKLSVGAGVHKARLDLNEEGAQAAAATAFFSYRMGGDDEETILETLGVGNLFHSEADFSTLSPEKLSVGAAVHKARLDLNEEGAQAAAATSFFSYRVGDEEEEILESMGVGDLFQQSVDFSTLTSDRVDLGRGIHKARIEINEQGTKAAAATALFTFRSSRPLEPARFICNHPFVYVIYDNEEKAILFTGVFRRPY